MKRCSRCGIEKPNGEFHKNNRSPDGLKSACKACVKEASHRAYLKNKDRFLARNKEWKQSNPDYVHNEYKRRSAKNRSLIDSLKSPCAKCGESRLYTIQFHHIDPVTKKFTLGEITSHGEQELKNEAAKCVCLCANCHFEFHYFFGNEPEHPFEALCEYLEREPYVV